MCVCVLCRLSRLNNNFNTRTNAVEVINSHFYFYSVVDCRLNVEKHTSTTAKYINLD